MGCQEQGGEGILALLGGEFGFGLEDGQYRCQVFAAHQLQKAGVGELVRLEQEAEQVRLFRSEADVAQADGQHGVAGGKVDVHQVIGMECVGFLVDLLFQIFHGGEMVHHRLGGALEPGGNGPGVERINALLPEKPEARFHDHVFCDFWLWRQEITS